MSPAQEQAANDFVYHQVDHTWHL